MSQELFARVSGKTNNIEVGIEIYLDTHKKVVWVQTNVFCDVPADINRVYTYKLKGFSDDEFGQNDYELCSGEMTHIFGIDMDKFHIPAITKCPRLSAMSEPIAFGDFKAGVIGIHSFELKDSVSDVCEIFDFRVVEWKGIGGEKPCAIDMVRPNMLRMTIPGAKPKEVEPSEGVLRLRKMYPGKTDDEILTILSGLLDKEQQ